MKKTIVLLFLTALVLGFAVCLMGVMIALRPPKTAEILSFPETTLAVETTQALETTLPTEPAAVPTETAPPAETAPVTLPAETAPVQAYFFTDEEEDLLLRLAMAERGDTDCVTCMALVMRTVLNRVEGPKFSSTIRGVVYAQDQFTPVSDGSFDQTVPSSRCREALELVKTGWDESQGALYYEWCEGESWHSQNLNLLFQHCDTRFYN